MAIAQAPRRFCAWTNPRPGRAIFPPDPVGITSAAIEFWRSALCHPWTAARQKQRLRACPEPDRYRLATDLFSTVPRALPSAAKTNRVDPFAPLRILQGQYELHHVAVTR